MKEIFVGNKTYIYYGSNDISIMKFCLSTVMLSQFEMVTLLLGHPVFLLLLKSWRQLHVKKTSFLFTFETVLCCMYFKFIVRKIRTVCYVSCWYCKFRPLFSNMLHDTKLLTFQSITLMPAREFLLNRHSQCWLVHYI